MVKASRELPERRRQGVQNFRDLSRDVAVLSQLQLDRIVKVAHDCGADAIHPGYGFLSENARFAEILAAHGYVFIGPKPEHIKVMNNDQVEVERFVLSVSRAAKQGVAG